MADVEKIIEQIDRQNAEFEALQKLCQEREALMRVPIVDDEYPEARHRYDSARMAFLDVVVKNQFGQANMTWAGLVHCVTVDMRTPSVDAY